MARPVSLWSLLLSLTAKLQESKTSSVVRTDKASRLYQIKNQELLDKSLTESKQ
jgi:outer membrane protein assembly factor BamD (BamD/ComL family)